MTAEVHYDVISNEPPPRSTTSRLKRALVGTAVAGLVLIIAAFFAGRGSVTQPPPSQEVAMFHGIYRNIVYLREVVTIHEQSFSALDGTTLAAAYNGDDAAIDKLQLNAYAGLILNTHHLNCHGLVILYNTLIDSLRVGTKQELAAAGLPENINSNYCQGGEAG